MPVQLFAPLSRAWEQMKTMLFKPFDLSVWLKVGFTAFLAGLLDGGGGSRGGNGADSDTNFSQVFTFPHKAIEFLSEHPGWLVLVVFGVIIAIIFLVLFLWLSSRGKFMFLDNVAHRRARISEPWHDYASQGDSLFLWRLGFTVVVLVTVLAFLQYAWRNAYELYSKIPGDVPVLFLIQMGVVLLGLVLVFGYVKLLLNDFIVPIMYKHRCRSTEAWSRFLNIHWPHFGSFLLYALFVLFAFIIIGAVILAAGLMTCCFLFLLLAIPYINSVILLPISYTYRAFSVEFLTQFGEPYTVPLPPVADQSEQSNESRA